MNLIVTKDHGAVDVKGKKLEIKGLYQGWDGLVSPVVKCGKHLGLLDARSAKYDTVMAFLHEYAGVTYFHNPSRGFWKGSDIARVVEKAGGKVQILRLDTYYTLYDIRLGCHSWSYSLECLRPKANRI